MTPERRLEPRRRTVFGATLRYDNRSSTLSCRVRNMNAHGAQLQLDQPHWVPDHFEIEVEPDRLATPARVVWRGQGALGIRFDDRPDGEDIESLNREQVLLARIARLEREKLALENRIRQLTEEF